MKTKKNLFVLLCIIFSFLCTSLLIIDNLQKKNVYSIEKVTNEDLSEQQIESVKDTKSSKKQNLFSIIINLDTLSMQVYKNDELIQTYPVSGGKASTPSPLGTWKIISKATWGEGFGGTWMGFNVPWGKYGIHGTIYPWFIGRTNSSKGCIRMKNKDVKELSRLIPIGTSVTIIHNNPIFRNLKSGDLGSDVIDIKVKLSKLSYYSGNKNGHFNKELKNSLIKFQQKNKLPLTGRVDKSTYNLILQQYLQLTEFYEYELSPYE